MNRKEFLKSGLLIGTSYAIVDPINTANDPLFTLEQIKEFVFAAHKDFDLTKNIVDKNPLIINCNNQAKKGDFETALGGASHMGRKDIADMLIQRGARLDMFSMTFLGYTQFVKDLIQLNPHYLNAPGPHGFTLLHHAHVGGQKDFAAWLKKSGLTSTRFEDAF